MRFFPKFSKADTNRDFREGSKYHEQPDALPIGGVTKSISCDTSTASSQLKGKGKANEDVVNDEVVTLPSVIDFQFKFIIFDPLTGRQFVTDDIKSDLLASRQVRKRVS